MDEDLTSPAPGSRLGALLMRWRSLVGIASGISVIVGAIISVGQFREFVDNSVKGDMSRRLAALSHVKEFFAEDAKIARRAHRFLDTHWREIQPRIAQKIEVAGGGEAFYLSDEMADYAAVHYHYEQLGALVKLGYIEFTLVYEIIAFPDEYMDRTAPLRQALAANWKGPGKPLNDLGSNIQWLRACYEFSRKLPPGKEPGCPGG
ncbi:hypothetical protein QRD43_20315 [Pelomonas sp. APW6]|uniref:DUF4760 domain-containing protein n=1 Tax=Roseateles subflavus TaxID=3053353 RepID=A0ABT7LPV5_9BURK|nr:hypothetical protein [Pelomonas sp. APW6]MDL5034257.1 hypothetical protein [Pelomonas sp. APW6]